MGHLTILRTHDVQAIRYQQLCYKGTRWGCGGLVVNNSDSRSRDWVFEPHSGRRVVSLSKTYIPPKVLVIPRERWLRPNMTEKLFTGTLSIKQTKNKKKKKRNQSTSQSLPVLMDEKLKLHDSKRNKVRI